MAKASPKNDRLTVICAAILGTVLLLAWGYPQRSRALAGHNDFLQLYTGATLVGSPSLYSPAANREVHLRSAGLTLEGVYYSRPPFYAFLLQPLAALPYRTAYAVFQCFNFAAIGVFLWLYARRLPEVAVFASLFLPLLCDLLNGQDASFVLCLTGAAILSLRRGRPFLAGLLLSLCAIKFHLLVLVPIAFLLHKQWRVLAGGAAGGGVLVALSFLAQGWDWPLRYLELLRNPVLHPAQDHSASLRGITEQWIVLAPLTIAAIALVIWAVRKTDDVELSFAYALTGSILVSYHCYLQDTLVLLLAFALVAEKATGGALRGTAALIVSPPLALCLLVGAPYNMAMPAALLVFLFIACRPWTLFQPDAVPLERVAES